MTLADLNADVLFIIFNELRTEDILTLLEVIPANILIAVANDIPFNGVTDLSLHVEITMKSRGLSLCQLFLNVRQMKLMTWWSKSNFDESFIRCEFPHLEQISLNMPYAENKNIFFGVFSKNPHIRGIAVFDLTQDVCNLINEYLPNFESLSFFRCEIEYDTRFEHIKHLKAHNMIASTLNKTDNT